MKRAIKEQGIILVTKLSGAQRQIDAGIRMTFSGEDPLAIHTVAAAAYRLLRDIKQKRGRSELADILGRSLFYIAKDIVAEKPESIPKELISEPQLMKIIETIVDSMRNGEFQTPDQVAMIVSIHNEHKHWSEFNIPANFLKHADLDSSRALSSNKLNNDFLLASASAAYHDVMRYYTPEMIAFGIYCFGDNPNFKMPPIWSIEASKKFTTLSPAKRRRFCRVYPIDICSWYPYTICRSGGSHDENAHGSRVFPQVSG